MVLRSSGWDGTSTKGFASPMPQMEATLKPLNGIEKGRMLTTSIANLLLDGFTNKAYLLVTSVYQGLERIKVRDFHNLIGRAGRAGMHTEGTILFADPNVYDKRRSPDQSWRWSQVRELLEPANSEPCVSSLL